MEGEFKVRAVEFEEKGVVEIENQLLKEHEEKLNGEPDSNVIDTSNLQPAVEENTVEEMDEP